MKWLVRKFWGVVLLASALLGVAYFPSDFMAREQAFDAIWQTLTMSNRESLLILLCAALVLRLFYLDMRRALNDPDWPPVRQKLRHGLATVFRESARVAEIQKVVSDEGVRKARDGADIARDVAIANLLLISIDWSAVGPLAIHGEEVRLTDEMDGIAKNSRHRWVEQALYAKISEIGVRFNPIFRALQSGGATNETYVIKLQQLIEGHPSQAPSGAVFPSDSAKAAWEATQGRIDRFNHLLRSLKVQLQTKANDADSCVSPTERWWSQVHDSIEKEMRH